jgi:hypothetical protein
MICTASLTSQAKVELTHIVVIRNHLLNVLYLVYVIIWEVFQERTADVLRLFVVLLTSFLTLGTGARSTTTRTIRLLIIAHILLVTLSGHQHRVDVIVSIVVNCDPFLKEHLLFLFDLLGLLPLLLFSFVLLIS